MGSLVWKAMYVEMSQTRIPQSWREASQALFKPSWLATPLSATMYFPMCRLAEFIKWM